MIAQHNMANRHIPSLNSYNLVIISYEARSCSIICIIVADVFYLHPKDYSASLLHYSPENSGTDIAPHPVGLYPVPAPGYILFSYI